MASVVVAKHELQRSETWGSRVESFEEMMDHLLLKHWACGTELERELRS